MNFWHAEMGVITVPICLQTNYDIKYCLTA